MTRLIWYISIQYQPDPQGTNVYENILCWGGWPGTIPNFRSAQWNHYKLLHHGRRQLILIFSCIQRLQQRFSDLHSFPLFAPVGCEYGVGRNSILFTVVAVFFTQIFCLFNHSLVSEINPCVHRAVPERSCYPFTYFSILVLFVCDNTLYMFVILSDKNSIGIIFEMTNAASS